MRYLLPYVWLLNGIQWCNNLICDECGSELEEHECDCEYCDIQWLCPECGAIEV